MKRNLFALSIMIMASIACGVFSSPGEPSGIPGFQPSTAENDLQLCQKGWEIKPVAGYTYPIGNATNIVIVDLGIKNGSKYWGSFTIDTATNATNSKVTLTTQDNSAIQAIDYVPGAGVVYTLPSTPESIYAGAPYGDGSTSFSTNGIAPGTVDTGYTYPLWANAKPYHFHFAFRVPDSQSHFHMKMSNVKLSCFDISVQENGQIYTHQTGQVLLKDIDFDLDKDTGYLEPNTMSQQTFNGSIKIPGYIDLSINKLYRDGESIKVSFSVTNNTTGPFIAPLHPYIVAEDGLQRYPDCASLEECAKLNIFGSDDKNEIQFDTVANKTIEEEVYFTVPSNLKNLTFAIAPNDDFGTALFKLNP